MFWTKLFLICFMTGVTLAGCKKQADENNEEPNEMYKKYHVPKTVQPPQLKGKWNGKIWEKVKPLSVDEYMGQKPQHMPKTQAKLLYDDNNIYVIFRVEDKYVKAVAQNYHDMVCFDSCVEIFFTPGPDTSKGYFNLEMNCGGTMLFYHQIERGKKVKQISVDDCNKIEVYHSLPKIVKPEEKEPVTWIVEYRLPLKVLEKYAPVVRPEPGARWRANFYKCADKTSHPHWLTWAVVDRPRPDFHRPDYFGYLVFEKEKSTEP